MLFASNFLSTSFVFSEKSKPHCYYIKWIPILYYKIGIFVFMKILLEKRYLEMALFSFSVSPLCTTGNPFRWFSRYTQIKLQIWSLDVFQGGVTLSLPIPKELIWTFNDFDKHQHSRNYITNHYVLEITVVNIHTCAILVKCQFCPNRDRWHPYST